LVRFGGDNNTISMALWRPKYRSAEVASCRTEKIDDVPGRTTIAYIQAIVGWKLRCGQFLTGTAVRPRADYEWCTIWRSV